MATPFEDARRKSGLHGGRVCATHQLPPLEVPRVHDPEIIIIPAVFGIPAIVMVIRMWFRHKEKMATLTLPVAMEQSVSIDDRLARVEQAVEAIAIEMERVGEGQRFLTKILAERIPPGLADGSAAQRHPVITPH